MSTVAASRFDDRELDLLCGVASRRQLRGLDIGPDDVAAQVAAHRWQTFGSAVVLHNGALNDEQYRQVARIRCGPRAVLTSFTAAEVFGLRGWERPEVHVLAPAGTTRPPVRGLILHRTGDWARTDVISGRALHRLPAALLLAATSFATPRPACGLLAAGVQQRLVSADDLITAIADTPRMRHRATLLAAMHDIRQGADSLAEIDFVRLCRRLRLPPPTLQAIRLEPSGQRRYLDVEWRLVDGRIVAVEVDGAIHVRADRWVADQLRHNEIVIGGTVVLRYPSVIVRTEPELVARQLRRILLSRS